MTFGEKLKKIRIERNMTQDELAVLLETSKQVISRYETNQRTPKITVANEYAKRLNVSTEYLLDNSATPYDYANIIPFPSMRKIPLLGTIACGDPILAVENIECDVDVPENINADFALRCKGDSMIDANIYDGDIVFIRQQLTVNNGEIAAVLIDDEATLKRVYLKSGTLTLMPCNNNFEPFVYSGEALNEIRILGKAVYFLSKVK